MTIKILEIYQFIVCIKVSFYDKNRILIFIDEFHCYVRAIPMYVSQNPFLIEQNNKIISTKQMIVDLISFYFLRYFPLSSKTFIC